MLAQGLEIGAANSQLYFSGFTGDIFTKRRVALLDKWLYLSAISISTVNIHAVGQHSQRCLIIRECGPLILWLFKHCREQDYLLGYHLIHLSQGCKFPESCQFQLEELNQQFSVVCRAFTSTKLHFDHTLEQLVKEHESQMRVISANLVRNDKIVPNDGECLITSQFVPKFIAIINRARAAVSNHLRAVATQLMPEEAPTLHFIPRDGQLRTRRSMKEALPVIKDSCAFLASLEDIVLFFKGQQAFGRDMVKLKKVFMEFHLQLPLRIVCAPSCGK